MKPESGVFIVVMAVHYRASQTANDRRWLRMEEKWMGEIGKGVAFFLKNSMAV
jgi:hypothetical protein